MQVNSLEKSEVEGRPKYDMISKMLPHINVLTETCIKANVLLRELDILCKMDGALQEGEARGNNKLKGAKQRLELL